MTLQSSLDQITAEMARLTSERDGAASERDIATRERDHYRQELGKAVAVIGEQRRMIADLQKENRRQVQARAAATQFAQEINRNLMGIAAVEQHTNGNIEGLAKRIAEVQVPDAKSAQS